MMIDDETNTSVLDPSQTLRIIRSHRATRRKPHVSGRATLVAAAVLAVTAILPVGSGTSIPPAQAEVVAPVQAAPELPERGMNVSRSAVRSSTRTQRINKVITFAKKQQGKRYRWGAAGPNAYDCSGLVVRSFKAAGIKLPHYTGSLLKRGKKISRKNLQRGDLVFPSRHHVGIYIGNGKMIVASTGAGKVKIQKVYAFYTARRIL
jgi:cell wall-associated NlpC family hydrolase